MADEFDPERVAWVLDRKSLDFMLGAIADCEEVVADLETTLLDEYNAQQLEVAPAIVLGSFTLPMPGQRDPVTWVVPLAHPDSPWLNRWRTVITEIALEIRKHRKPISNHNVKFDARWIYAHTGLDLSHLIAWDTQISSHMLDENASSKLKEVAPALFGIPPWDEFDLTMPGAALRIPLFDLGMYAARDTYWTWRLKLAHVAMMLHGDEPEGPEEVEQRRLGRLAVWCSMPTTATLTAIEQRGMELDADWTQAELKQRLDIVTDLTDLLSDRYDMEREDASFAATSHWFRDFTQKAVDAGDLIVAELTGTGKPRWNKAVLVRQARAGSDTAQQILNLRGAAKQAEYLTSWLAHQAEDGRVHAGYNAGRVVTGRLSSSEPNMQQVTEVLKPAWVPSEGYLFADFDYSQIELRVTAFVSRCEPMLVAFRRGDDLHKILASVITGKLVDDVLEPERQAGKSANFGLIYGMGVYGFREYAETVYGISFTLEEAARIHRAFFATWIGIQAWHAKSVKRAHETGQVISPIGRVRRLPDIWDANEQLVAYNERAAINAPVQGFASDLMQIAAASVEGNLPGYQAVRGARLVGTVHDSILAEVPADDWQNTVAACRARMLDVVPILKTMDCDFDVPLAVDVKVGTRWGLADIATIK